MSAAEADVLATREAPRTGLALPGRFLRSELAIVFGRRRNLVLLGVLAAIPVLLAIAIRVSSDADEPGAVKPAASACSTVSKYTSAMVWV